MAELFTQVLDLKKKDVFLETKVNDNKYFSITGLPSVLSYGKHPFSITFNDPDGEPLLKDLSNIVFEITDSRGTIIFSNLIDSDVVEASEVVTCNLARGVSVPIPTLPLCNVVRCTELLVPKLTVFPLFAFK